MDTKLERLAQLAAQELAGKDRHRLNEIQGEMVQILEEHNLLAVNKPANGFVGKAINPAACSVRFLLPLEA